MRTSEFSLLPFLLLCFSAQSVAQGSANTFSALDGAWHLAPARGAMPDGFSFGVLGNTIYGEGYVYLVCDPGNPYRGQIVDVQVEGSISPDGGFLIHNLEVASFIMPANALTIQGETPQPGGAQWSGRLTISKFTRTDANHSECPSTSIDFTANRLPPLRGVYTGTFRFGGTSHGQTGQDETADADGHVSLEIEQGEVTATGLKGVFAHVIPAKVKMTISDSSIIPSITLVTVSDINSAADQASIANSRISGENRFSAEFPPDKDGDEFHAFGSLDAKNPNRLSVIIDFARKDANGKYYIETARGWLVRQ